MNKDERDGKAESIKGRVKEAAGIIVDNPELEREGAEERDLGKAREQLGKARRKVGEAIENLGDKIKR